MVVDKLLIINSKDIFSTEFFQQEREWHFFMETIAANEYFISGKDILFNDINYIGKVPHQRTSDNVLILSDLRRSKSPYLLHLVYQRMVFRLKYDSIVSNQVHS